MDNKKIPTHIGTIVLVIIAITAGAFVWVYERGQGWDTDMAVMQLRSVPKEVVKIDSNKSELKPPVSEPEYAKPIVFEPFEKWATYKNNVMGIEMKYPHELFLNTKDSNKIIFDYLGQNDPGQAMEGSQLVEFKISLQKDSVNNLINKRKLDNLRNFEQKSIQLNGISAQQIVYSDAFAGGALYETYIPYGTNTILIWYAGDNQLENTYHKMVLTIKYQK